MAERPFLPGLDLAASFYAEVIAPLVTRPHAAALLGPGSDVLGLDTARSTDHDWGPRLLLFLAAVDVEPALAEVEAGLPESFRGWPTRFGSDRHPLHHGVVATTLRDWVTTEIGADPLAAPLTVPQWLVVPQQQLLGVVRGRVFADPDGALARVQERLAYYPRDVWLWLLACEWRRIAQEAAFVGRCAEVGDDTGSRLVAARLVGALMRLAFLQERTYWPYAKWFGTAFAQLAGAAELGPALARVLSAGSFAERECALVVGYELLARRHNALGITAEVEPTVRTFHDRPFLVLDSDRFAAACLSEVDDPWLRAQPLIGSARC